MDTANKSISNEEIFEALIWIYKAIQTGIVDNSTIPVVFKDISISDD
jgi:hypothetical protein